MPPKKAHTRGGGKSKQTPPVKQGRGSTPSKTKKRKSPPSSESGSEFEPDDNHHHHAKRGRMANKPAQTRGGGKAKSSAKAKRVTRKDEQSDGTEEEDDDDEDSDKSTAEGEEGPPLDSPPSQDMDSSAMISLTQTATSRENRAKRYKVWAAEQLKAFEEAFVIAPTAPPEGRKDTQKVKKVIDDCKAELEESKQAWKGVMRAIDQKTKGMNEMTGSLKANCRDARGPMIAALQAAIEEAKGYDGRLAATIAKAEAMRDADIRSKTDAFRKRDDAGVFIASLRRLVKVAK